MGEAEVFMSALSEEECLQDNNKYWCDHCFHHNEARRSVHFSQLPHHLVIHVKRFSAFHRLVILPSFLPSFLPYPCVCLSSVMCWVFFYLLFKFVKLNVFNIFFFLYLLFKVI